MVRATAEKVGRGKCPDCGEPVMYRRSAGGFLTHKCDACDSNGYAEPGGAAYGKRMASIDAPSPIGVATKGAALAPTKKPAPKGFDLSAL